MSYSGKFKDKNNNLHPVTSVLYGTCDTAAATAAKVVTCTDFDALMTGVTIRVKFANSNTAASPTVNINSTGAKSVYRFGATAPVDGNSWNAGEVVELVYDGTSFFMTGADDLSVKQNATDNSLDTEDKTIVGAINEHEDDIGSLKSGFTNLDNEVNGDATVYPYADVITIEDAVPSNLADCNVKIEPVQDLHGYDKPWVGGAGKNKQNIGASVTTEEVNGITYTITRNSSDAVIEIDLDGTASSNSYKSLGSTTLPTGGYIVNGVNGGSTSTYYIDYSFGGSIVKSYNGDATMTLNSDTSVSAFINVVNGVTLNHVKIYPMIRLATETDATFAPYTNLCPISGHTEVDVTRADRHDTYTALNTQIAGCNLIITEDGHVTIKGKTTSPFDKYISDGMVGDGVTTYKVINVPSLSSELDYYIYDTTSSTRIVTFKTSETSEFIIPSGHIAKFGLIAVNASGVDIDLDMRPIIATANSISCVTIALGSTIYGGTVDFDSGVMTVDKKLVDLGDYTWAPSGDNFYTSEITDFAYNMSDVGAIKRCPYFISDKYASSSTTPNIDLFFNSGYSGYRCFINGDTSASGMTGAEFKEYVTGTHLCYELATPFTVQLTPQQIQLLKGTNTITASTGQLSVTVNGVAGAIGAVQEQVNGLESGVFKSIKKITSDGVKTYSDMFSELFSDITGTAKYYILYNNSIFTMSAKTTQFATFSRIVYSASTIYITALHIKSDSSASVVEAEITENGTTLNNYSTDVMPANLTIELVM